MSQKRKVETIYAEQYLYDTPKFRQDEYGNRLLQVSNLSSSLFEKIQRAREDPSDLPLRGQIHNLAEKFELAIKQMVDWLDNPITTHEMHNKQQRSIECTKGPLDDFYDGDEDRQDLESTTSIEPEETVTARIYKFPNTEKKDDDGMKIKEWCATK